VGAPGHGLFVGGVCGGFFCLVIRTMRLFWEFFLSFLVVCVCVCVCVCLVGVAGDDMVRWSAVFGCKELGGVGGCRVGWVRLSLSLSLWISGVGVRNRC
jgi:hypothetical protein